MSSPAKKTSKSQIWASVALLSLLMAPAVFFISTENGDRIEALRKEGLVTEATVLGKRRVEEPYTDSKGRTKTTTTSYIDMEYDSQTSQTYQDWLTGGEKAQPAVPGHAMSSYAYRSTNADYDAAKPGDKLPVVIHRYERTRAELASYVKTYNNRMMMLFGALCGLLGLASAAMAWRTRAGKAE